MERSLSVLLPVHNAQSTLSATVHEVLDVLPEMTRRFDVVIVDDGSTDATSEVAQELVRHYPQVRAVHRGQPSGRDQAIRAALQQTSGEIILLCEEHGGLAIDEIHKLWKAMDKPDGVSGPPECPAAANRHCQRPGDHGRQAGYRMVHRTVLEAMDDSIGQPAPSQPEPAPCKPNRPNYLARLKNFALGQ